MVHKVVSVMRRWEYFDYPWKAKSIRGNKASLGHWSAQNHKVLLGTNKRMINNEESSHFIAVVISYKGVKTLKAKEVTNHDP